MKPSKRRVLVTGARGFIGRNLVLRLEEQKRFEVADFLRDSDPAGLPELVKWADAVVHLAGENRPSDERAFAEVNAGLTQKLCEAMEARGGSATLILASSIHAERETPYGRSKREGERAVESYVEMCGASASIFRLPGVFGKWCRPDYNSVVATFCHRIARGLPVEIHDPRAELRLAYIDDVCEALIEAIDTPLPGLTRREVRPEYAITLGQLAEQIQAFEDCRTTLVTERVGFGLGRALYATYLSYLPPERFFYELPQHGDARGVFVEMLKTKDSGQFSFFTAHPGITRGGHYHHSKTEKFLVLKGEALFRFRHLVTGETYQVRTSGDKVQVVDTIPGWAHDVTNVGEEEMIVMLWANEIFDREKPDTISSKL